MGGVDWMIVCSLLLRGYTFATDEAGDIHGGSSSPENPSSVYNPVNCITFNIDCNPSEQDDNKLQDGVREIKEGLNHLITTLKSSDFCVGSAPITAPAPTITLSKEDCFDIQQNGETTSGVYTITPHKSSSFEVYCDMDTDGGGWTVFQRRVDDSVDFALNWVPYKVGFGDLEGNHWLGNDHLHYLTNQKAYELRVDLEDFEDATRYAVYDFFHITDESHKYRLTLGEYSGDAGDAMGICDEQRFSTIDDDNGCAIAYRGGWWYENCHYANLNGLYLWGSHSFFANGIEWFQWKGHNYSLKFTEMKLRPV